MKVPFFDRISHYDWLYLHLIDFWKKIDLPGAGQWQNEGMIVAHGDKCYSSDKSAWEAAGLHFFHGVAIYLTGRCSPYIQEIDPQRTGCIAGIGKWVLDNKDRFLPYLPPIPFEKNCADCHGGGITKDRTFCECGLHKKLHAKGNP